MFVRIIISSLTLILSSTLIMTLVVVYYAGMPVELFIKSYLYNIFPILLAYVCTMSPVYLTICLLSNKVSRSLFYTIIYLSFSTYIAINVFNFSSSGSEALPTGVATLVFGCIIWVMLGNIRSAKTDRSIEDKFD